MLPKERIKMEKYRKRLSLSILIIVSLSIWIIRKYNDVSYLDYDVKILEYESRSKDYEIFKLKHKIDSLEKLNKDIKKPKENKIIKIDSVVIKSFPKENKIIKIDSVVIKSFPIDTINLK